LRRASARKGLPDPASRDAAAGGAALAAAGFFVNPESCPHEPVDKRDGHPVYCLKRDYCPDYTARARPATTRRAVP